MSNPKTGQVHESHDARVARLCSECEAAIDAHLDGAGGGTKMAVAPPVQGPFGDVFKQLLKTLLPVLLPILLDVLNKDGAPKAG